MSSIRHEKVAQRGRGLCSSYVYEAAAPPPLEFFKWPFSGKKKSNIRAKPLDFRESTGESIRARDLSPPPPPPKKKKTHTHKKKHETGPVRQWCLCMFSSSWVHFGISFKGYRGILQVIWLRDKYFDEKKKVFWSKNWSGNGRHYRPSCVFKVACGCIRRPCYHVTEVKIIWRLSSVVHSIKPLTYQYQLSWLQFLFIFYVVYSISMTSMSTLVGIGLMPLNLFIYGRRWTDKNTTIPFVNIFLSLLFIIIPVAIGMLIRWKREKWTKIIGNVSYFF